MSNSKHFDNAKGLVAILAVALMAGVFMIFNQNRDTIINNNQFYYFMTLAVFGAGLLIGLVYLVGKGEHKHKAAARKVHKKKRSSR